MYTIGVLYILVNKSCILFIILGILKLLVFHVLLKITVKLINEKTTNANKDINSI